MSRTESSQRAVVVFTAKLGPQVADTSAVRLRLARWLDGIGIEDHEAIDDVLLIVSELATNAIRAACTQAHARVALGPRDLEVEVSDDGPGLPPEARAVLDASAPAADRLRGLYLVSELSDEVTVSSGAAGTVIRCRRRR